MSSSHALVIDRLAQLVTTDTARVLDRVEAVLLIDHLVCLSQSRAVQDVDPERSGPIERAAQRASLACAADRDDVSWAQLVHPGSVVWSVVLALGRVEESSGAEVLRAARAGYEMTERCAELFGPAEKARFHLTPAAGTVGAAAAASAIWRQPLEQTSDALGHAVSVMGGSAGCLHERSGTRQFHLSHAVRSGMAAASAAAEGLHATRGDLTHGWGLLEALDDEQVVTLLRQPFRASSNTSVRPFPTSGWNQAVYEAARSAAGQAKGRISGIRVAASPRVVAASKSHPRKADESWVRLEWAAARAVASMVGQDPRELLDDVRVVSRDGPAASVDVLASSASGASEVAAPLGHPERPVTSDVLGLKWSMSADDVENLVDQVGDLLAGTSTGAVERIETAVAVSQTTTSPIKETP